jgi:hypothetical protein
MQIPQAELDTNALYDAPLRELIGKLIERKYSPNPSENIELEIAKLQSHTNKFTQQGCLPCRTRLSSLPLFDLSVLV